MDDVSDFYNSNTLNRGAMLELLIRSEPITVLSLCQTDHNFSSLCRSQDTFKTLMQFHYPNYPLDFENPKEQYMRITSHMGIIYNIKIHDGHRIMEDNYGTLLYLGYVFDNRAYPISLSEDVISLNEAKSAKDNRPTEEVTTIKLAFEKYQEDNPDIDSDTFFALPDQGIPANTIINRSSVNFRVLGTKIRTGQVLWLYVLTLNGMVETKAFASFMDAIDYALETEFSGVKLENLINSHVENYLQYMRMTVSEKRKDYYLDNFSNMMFGDNEERTSIANKIMMKDLLFERYCIKRGIPVPFTVEGIKRYLLENKNILLYGESNEDLEIFGDNKSYIYKDEDYEKIIIPSHNGVTSMFVRKITLVDSIQIFPITIY